LPIVLPIISLLIHQAIHFFRCIFADLIADMELLHFWWAR